MKTLPENWNELSHLEKDKFFTRYYKHFIRPGETVGLNEDVSEEVKKAYEEFLKEKHD